MRARLPLSRFWTLLLTALLPLAAIGQITVTAPNGGETLQGCSTVTVTWAKGAASTTTQKIDFSVNGGRTYFNVVPSVATGSATTGSAVVNVPNIPSVKVRFKVSDVSSSTGSDASDANLTIVSASGSPGITILSPNGGEVFPQASTQRITWSSPTPGHTYLLYYGALSTANYTYIGKSNKGYYDWNITNQISRISLKLIDSAADCQVDFTDTTFRSDGTTPGIGLLNFNGGQVLTPGDNITINWNSHGITGQFVKVEFSSDNGQTYSTLTDTALVGGSFDWQVPAVGSTQCRFRISDAANPATSDVSNGTFTIIRPILRLAAQTVQGPLQGCARYNLAWTAQNTTGYFQLVFSDNGGRTWWPLSQVLNYGATGSFSYGVHVPSVNSSQCLFAVLDAFSSSSRDTVNSVFTVQSPTASLHIDYPNGNNVFGNSQAVQIRWSTNGAVGNVNLYYSQNNGLSFIPIVGNIANSGSFNWVTPAEPGSSYLVRVEQVSDSCLSDQSDSAFTASSVPIINLLAPQGGEIFFTGQTAIIRYTSANLAQGDSISIAFSADGGATYSPVATAANTGQYNWTIPGVATNQGRIKIASRQDPTVFSEEQANFIIQLNQPPTVNAGRDTSIRIFQQPFILRGQASDPDGSIASYTWSQVSGPAAATIGGGNTSNASLTNLVAGVYVFQLSVSDNLGLSTSDQVQVTVLPGPPAPPAFTWAVQGGGSGALDRAYAVTTDAQGNAYVVGSFYRTTQFSTSVSLTSAGSLDGFLAKYDSTGALVWVRSIGSLRDDELKSVCLLANGNIAVAGYFSANLTVSGTDQALVNLGYRDGLVACYNPSGRQLWAINTGTRGLDEASAVSSVGQSIYIGGFVGAPGSIGGIPFRFAGSVDALLVRTDFTGVPKWVQTFGSTGNDAVNAVFANQIGTNVGAAFAGYFSGNISLGGQTFRSEGGTDAIAAGVFESGVIYGAKKAGGELDDAFTGVAVALDTAARTAIYNSYLVGNFSGTLFYGNGQTIDAAGAQDGFLVAYNAQGTPLFGKAIGGRSDDQANGIVIARNKIWITGAVAGGPQFGDITPNVLGGQDVFLAGLNLGGDVKQYFLSGSNSDDVGRGIAAQINGALTVVGTFRGPFGVFGQARLRRIGFGDFFVARLSGAASSFRLGAPEGMAFEAPTFTLYPNPAAAGDVAQLQTINLAAGEQLTVDVLDATGRSISTTRYDVVSDGQAIGVPMPTTAGIYILVARTASTRYTQKITVR